MNKKRLVCLLLAGVMVFALAGCQKDAPAETDATAQTEITEPTQPEPSADPEEPDSSEPSQEPEDTQVVPMDPEAIIANWASICRYETDGVSTLVQVMLYFSKYGSGVVGVLDIISWDNETGYLADNSGRYDRDDYFTYTFDGRTLTLTYEDGSQEIYTVCSTEDGQGFTMTCADEENPLAGNLFLLGDLVITFTLEEMFANFNIDSGLFQPGDPQHPPTPDNTDPPVQPDVPADNSWIEGTWNTIFRIDEEYYSSLLEYTITFYSNGYGVISDLEWISMNQEMGGPGTDWEVAGRGYISDDISYTLEGDKLYITFMANDFEDYEDYTITLFLSRSEDGTMSLTDANGTSNSNYGIGGKTYVHDDPDNPMSLEELCGILGVDVSLPQF